MCLRWSTFSILREVQQSYFAISELDFSCHPQWSVHKIGCIENVDQSLLWCQKGTIIGALLIYPSSENDRHLLPFFILYLYVSCNHSIDTFNYTTFLWISHARKSFMLVRAPPISNFAFCIMRQSTLHINNTFPSKKLYYTDLDLTNAAHWGNQFGFPLTKLSFNFRITICILQYFIYLFPLSKFYTFLYNTIDFILELLMLKHWIVKLYY